MSTRVTELDQLIKAFSDAQAAGDRATAERLIDRAWRIAPKNPEINRLFGLLLLSQGALDRGVALLDAAQIEDPDPETEALCITALCRAGASEAARKRLESALGRFAVARNGALAVAARTVALAMAPACTGWIGIAPDLTIHGELIGSDVPVKIETAEGTVTANRLSGNETSDIVPFEIPLNCLSLPATAVADTGKLLGGTLSLPPKFGFAGGIPAFEAGKLIPLDQKISGWATLFWDPQRPVDLTVSNDSGFSAKLPSSPDQLTPSRHRFTLSSALRRKAGNVITIAATMPDGTSCPLPGSPLIITPPPIPRPPTRNRRAAIGYPAETRGTDILIPVYSGMTETLDCIRSVRRTVGNDVCIIVVDDATPDPALAATLDKLAASQAITLLRNPQNLGFPESVNRAMQVNPDRDVVILNADTEVFGDWLVRLRTAAYSTASTGTATPLTNSGSIASYPASGNAQPDRASTANLDRLAKKVNKTVTVDIPTGVGFCLFVRRDCLDDVGYFDSAIFGAGYGEENDLCLRASDRGWRHVLATDVYIRHTGGRSFGARKAALYERNLRLLFLRYPGYHAQTDAFGEADPAHAARRRLDEARLTETTGKSVLIVNLALEGGTRRAVDERVAQIRADGLCPIVLRPVPDYPNRWKLTVGDGFYEDLFYDGQEELDGFFSLIRRLDIDHAELHHFLDLPPALIDGLFSIGRPVDAYIHDYIWYCPRVTLLNGENRYCGEPAVAVCEGCVASNGSRLAETISVSALRTRSLEWLTKARARFVPTPSVAARMEAQFPALPFQVRPLESVAATPAPLRPVSGRRIKVALIGALGDHKGFDRLLKMARYASERDLPIDFVVIGHTKNDSLLSDTGRIFVTGEFKEVEIGALIAREAPDLALFLSEFPETWCYTLTHALVGGIPVAGLDLGAIGDRLRNLSEAPMLFPLSSEAGRICDQIVAAFQALPHGNTSGANLGRPDETSRPIGDHGIIASQPTQLGLGELPRSIMATQLETLTATVDFLPLTRGLFLFSVKSAHAPIVASDDSGISLPAMQLSAPPGASGKYIEIISAPATGSAWLSRPHDSIVVKVSGPTTLLLTSIHGPDMTPVEVEIQRLDREPSDANGAVASAPLAAIPVTQKSISLKVLAHVQNRGDMEFGQSEWVGAPNERLAIESFSIVPLETLPLEAIEYKALTATGVETPWVPGGSSCGTRGIGVPLIGFAVRLNAEMVTDGACEYGAILASGTLIGPVRNGEVCRSSSPRDPIVGFWIAIGGRAADSIKASSTKSQKNPKPAKELAAAPSTSKPVAGKAGKGAGPRFSIFRSPTETE